MRIRKSNRKYWLTFLDDVNYKNVSANVKSDFANQFELVDFPYYVFSYLV